MDQVTMYNNKHGTCFDDDIFQELTVYAELNDIGFEDAIMYIQGCHSCGTQIDEDKIGSEYCSRQCYKNVKDLKFPCFYGNTCLLCEEYACVECKQTMKYDDEGIIVDDVLRFCAHCVTTVDLEIQDAIIHFNSSNGTYLSMNEIEHIMEYAQCRELSIEDAKKEFRQCHWGKDCDNCKQYAGEEKDRYNCECVKCKNMLTSHEGYIMDCGVTCCNACAVTFDEEAEYDEVKEFNATYETNYNKVEIRNIKDNANHYGITIENMINSFVRLTDDDLEFR